MKNSLKVMKISPKKAKKMFTSIGLGLILYILGVMYLPFALEKLLEIIPNSNFNINGINYLNLIISFICIVIGTLLPYTLISLSLKVNPKDYLKTPKITFIDLFLISALLISLGTIIIFGLNYLSSFIGFKVEYLYPIGISGLDVTLLKNPLFIFFFLFVAPLLEELFFRGLLLRVLGRYGNLFGIYAISGIYALFNQSISEIILGFFLSFFLCKMVLRYKSIVPVIFMHSLFNLFFLALSIVPRENTLYYALLLVVVYLSALVALFLKQYPNVKVSKSQNIKNIKLFFLRPSIIISIILAIVFPLITTFF